MAYQPNIKSITLGSSFATATDVGSLKALDEVWLDLTISSGSKGFLKVNYDADIVIVDMDKEKTITNEDMHSKCGWTAFDGFTTKGWPITTIVNGNIVYNDEKLNLDIRGKKVEFSS